VHAGKAGVTGNSGDIWSHKATHTVYNRITRRSAAISPSPGTPDRCARTSWGTCCSVSGSLRH
jgi:hypothetical protein